MLKHSESTVSLSFQAELLRFQSSPESPFTGRMALSYHRSYSPYLSYFHGHERKPEGMERMTEWIE